MSLRTHSLTLIAAAWLAGAGGAIACPTEHAAPTHTAPASAPAATAISITNSWVRGTVAGQKATGAFMQLRAPTDAKLLGVSSTITPVVQLHTMHMDNGVMRMREIPSLDLPAGQTVELKPGSYHIMLMNLNAPLQKGQTIPLTLKLQSADGKLFEQTIEAPVRALTGRKNEHHHHHHGHDNSKHEHKHHHEKHTHDHAHHGHKHEDAHQHEHKHDHKEHAH